MAIKKASQEGLIEFSCVVDAKYDPQWFHKEIADKLEEVYTRVKKGESPRVMIFMPPRHGKSDEATQKYPAWLLGKEPTWPIIVASYSQDLATNFGQGTRDLMENGNYKYLFNTRLRADTSAKANWMTDKGGGYLAVGVGGSITGKGFKVGIVDDPFKNREEADSPVVRESVWKWYASTFGTREEGASAIIVILCMTGDTPVLMKNGTEKLLRDIKIGDEVATYDNGKLSSSFVKNWVNHGEDNVFTITMSSGKIVKANARHPFLTNNNGKLTWTRVKDLTTNHKIVTLRDNGVNGKERNVSTKNVKNLQDVEDIVRPTIIKRNGLTVIDRLQSTLNRVGMLASNIAMGLRQKIMTKPSKNKVVDAPYANNCQQKMSGLIGEGNYALTTITPQEKSGRFYAMIAISSSAMQKLLKLLWPRPNTSNFILDNVVSIQANGMEDVFDIQVERTENFIANGLVSHNTRWHDDDLAGRLLRQQAESEKNNAEYYDKWEVLEFKAIAEQDEKHRKTGDALWPDKFSYEKLMTKKNSMGSYEWSALYQQNPIDVENQEFKKDWLQYRSFDDIEKMNVRKFATIDPAGSKKKESDSTGVTRNYVNDKNEWNIKTKKYRINSKQIIDLIFELHAEGFEKIGIEQGVYSEAIEPFFVDEKEKRNIYPNVIPLKHGGTMKETRIRGLIPRYENRKIWHISGFCDDLEEEYLRFPKSAHDDCLDSLAYQSQLVSQFSQGDSDYIDEYDISKNVMEMVNEQAGTVIIGVSTTSPCNYVVGNKESLFFHRTSDDWAKEIDYYLRPLPETGKPRWDNCIIIADQVGDTIGFNTLKDKHKGKIYFVELQKDKLNKEPVTFLVGKEFGKIEADRNRLLQQVIDEFKDKRIPMYGKLSDWEPICSQWSKLRRVWDKNAQGDPISIWETDAQQGFIKAILYWRIGMDKFGKEKGGFLGAREDLFPNKGEVFKLNPNGQN